MNIGFDTSRINIKDGSGRYTFEVVKYFIQEFPDNNYILFGPMPNKELPKGNVSFVEIEEGAGLKSRLLYCLTIANLIKKNKVDIFHNLSNYGFLFKPCPVVTTVHDILTLLHSNLRNRKLDKLLYKYLIPYLLNKADVITVSSKNTINDIKDNYGLESKLKLVYLGYDKEIFNKQSIDRDTEVLNKYGISPGYLFNVSYITPKKNIELIFEALADLKSQGIEPQFVIAGKRGFGADEIFRKAEELNVSSQVKEIGFVPDEDLASLYRSAKLFLFPSLYEGFGLPVLEAMACGTPSLVSNTGSLDEIVSQEKMKTNPDNPKEWAKRIFEFLSDESVYNSLVEDSLSISSNFSWEKCVDQINKNYLSLVK